MSFKFEHHNGEAVASIGGELDHHAAKDIIRAMRDAIDDTLPRSLTLDLSSLSFMDSSGIAVVLSAHRRMSELSGKLAVVHIPRQAERILRAAGVSRILPLG